MSKSRAARLALVAGLIAMNGASVTPAFAQQPAARPAPGPNASVLRAGTDDNNITYGNPDTPVSPGRTTASPDSVAGIPANYDESKVPPYELPDPLTFNNGAPVKTASDWTRRRAEIIALFEENQHGKSPGRPADMSFEVVETGPAFDGKAIRKQVKIYFTKDKSGPVLNLLSYTPTAAKGPAPILLNIGFGANRSTVPSDPAVLVNPVWNSREKARVMPAAPPPRPAPPAGAAPPAAANGGAAPVRRGIPVEDMLDAGIGFATFNYTDVDPDDHDAMFAGVRQLFLAPGQKYRKPDEWGALGAWAWGISRVVDYFETDANVDAKRVAITGSSRLGKTVLWAGAKDQRIAAVLASVSGEGGASLSHRIFGETIAHYTSPSRYPYQFSMNWARYAADPRTSPVDGNMLVSLIAPRPLLLQTGSTDYWSDPKGEFLSAVDAQRVYVLLGKEPLGTDTFPAPGVKVGKTLSYYMHNGGHGMIPSDWPVFIDFMKTYLKPGQ